MEKFIDFLIDTGSGLLGLIIQIFIIIVVILVLLEILRALGVIDFLNKILYRFTKYLGISKGASLPLFIGFFIGITYGAASIIESYKSKEMTKKDVILVSVFISLCHAIFEDTILFAALGAKLWIIVVLRFFIACTVTIILNLIISKREKNNIKENIHLN